MRLFKNLHKKSNKMKTLANAPFFTKRELISLLAVVLVLIALIVAVSFGDFSGMDNVQFIK